MNRLALCTLTIAVYANLPISMQWGPKKVGQSKHKKDISTERRNLFHRFTDVAFTGYIDGSDRTYYFEYANASNREEFSNEVCSASINSSLVYLNLSYIDPEFDRLFIGNQTAVTVSDIDSNWTKVTLYWECQRSERCVQKTYSCTALYKILAAIAFFIFFTVLVCLVCCLVRDMCLRKRTKHQVEPSRATTGNEHPISYEESIRMTDHRLLRRPSVFTKVAPINIKALATTPINVKPRSPPPQQEQQQTLNQNDTDMSLPDIHPGADKKQPVPDMDQSQLSTQIGAALAETRQTGDVSHSNTSSGVSSKRSSAKSTSSKLKRSNAVVPRLELSRQNSVLSEENW